MNIKKTGFSRYREAGFFVGNVAKIKVKWYPKRHWKINNRGYIGAGSDRRKKRDKTKMV